jgi:hypothetical protein
MLTDHDLEEMAKVFRSQKKFNAMGGMGLKLIGEIEVLRRQNRNAQVDGIKMAADIAGDYDHLSLHDYLVSECILGKLNVLRRKPQKNPTASKLDKAMDLVERKLSGLEGTMRFMAMSAHRRRKVKP